MVYQLLGLQNGVNQLPSLREVPKSNLNKDFVRYTITRAVGALFNPDPTKGGTLATSDDLKLLGGRLD